MSPLTDRKKRTLGRDTLAQVGIGTMIVFIATILVAATAAALLLDTSGKLQEKASRTGSESTQEVSSNLIVKAIYGDRGSTSGPLENLNISISLAPGASDVDLSTMVIKVIDGNDQADLVYSQTGGANTFTGVAVRDPKGTFSASAPVMAAGTLANLQINLTNAGGGMTLSEREDLQFFLIPENGAQVQVELLAPSSFGTDRIVVLR